jgi:hypothetical protein
MVMSRQLRTAAAITIQSPSWIFLTRKLL